MCFVCTRSLFSLSLAYVCVYIRVCMCATIYIHKLRYINIRDYTCSYLLYALYVNYEARK